MTWKEIKDKIESEGVEDSDEIDYIDIDGFQPIICVREDEGWRISD